MLSLGCPETYYGSKNDLELLLPLPLLSAEVSSVQPQTQICFSHSVFDFTIFCRNDFLQIQFPQPSRL